MLQRSGQELCVSARKQEGDWLVEAAGELHLPNVGLLRKSLQQVVQEPAGNVVLDFQQVVFMAAGMKALVDARKQLSLQGRTLSLRVEPGSQPDRVMQTSRLNMIISLRYD